MIIRRVCAVFAAAVICGCMLIQFMPGGAFAVEPGFPGILRSEAREEFERLLYRYDSFWDEPDASTVVYSPPGRESVPRFISKDDAQSDVDFLFVVLRYGYAGYQFFGGDKAFLQARQDILTEIDNFRGKNLTSSQFAAILQRRLGFVQDGHFSIARKSTCRRYRFFARFDMEFDELEDRFYVRQMPDRWVAAVEGEDPSRWMKMSLGSDGEVLYCLGTLSDADRDICVKLEWSDGSSEFVWLNGADSAIVWGLVYQLNHVEGIPVVVTRFLMPLPDTMAELDALVRDAAELREAPAVILDLRSNWGGSDWYPLEWARRFAGVDLYPAGFDAQLVTSTAAKMLENTASSLGAELPAVEDSAGSADVQSWLAGMADPDRPGWGRVSAAESVRAENDTLLVVLIDSNVYSAGESFVGILRQLDNVAFVGTNTYGATLAGNVGVCLLPNSRLELSCGSLISLGEDLCNYDGRGYMPDFWVRPDEALERAIEYIQTAPADGRGRW